MDKTIGIETSDKFNKKTQDFIEELLDIFPNSSLNLDNPDISIKLTEDTGPQFITIQTPETQMVFKIIDYRTRAQMGIANIIRKEPSQLVLANFNSPVGLSVAELFMNIFPVNVESNQVVNFTVHKDFLYFRMYRFCITKKGPEMEIIGPQITLRLWRIIEYSGEEKVVHNYKKYVKNLNLL
ncbi:ribosome production factor 1 [Enteropsectra breve]|nr:ribosome production factor 1 [Enteropsectra breve]